MVLLNCATLFFQANAPPPDPYSVRCAKPNGHFPSAHENLSLRYDSMKWLLKLQGPEEAARAAAQSKGLEPIIGFDWAVIALSFPKQGSWHS